jgi:hypothetical protein
MQRVRGRVRRLRSLRHSWIKAFQLALHGRAHVLELGELEEHLDHLFD